MRLSALLALAFAGQGLAESLEISSSTLRSCRAKKRVAHSPAPLSSDVSSSTSSAYSASSSPAALTSSSSYITSASSSADPLLVSASPSSGHSSVSPSDPSLAPSSTPSSTSSSAPSSSASPTPTKNPLAVTVAQDGSGQFTDINDGVHYAQVYSYPTVSVLPGTYTETVVVTGTATVTVIGATSTALARRSGSGSADTYANNAVTILVTSASSAVAPLSFGTSSSQGTTWHHINFVNSDAASSAGAASLRGFHHGFYGCQFVAAGTIGITGSYASALMAYSYLEAYDKLVYSYPSLYVFASTLTVTNNNGLLAYTRGATYATTGVLYNSTVVVDASAVVQKAGVANTNVYLGAASSAGSTVLYRNTSLPSNIAAAGAHNDTTTIQAANRYLEFETTGAGSYPEHAAARAGLVTWVTDPAVQLAPYELSSWLANQYPSVATTSTSWIDPDVLAAILGDDAQQEAEATAASSSASTTVSASASASVSASASATVDSHTLTVAATPTAGQYGTVSSALAAVPNDGAAYEIYILAGTYTEQLTINRTGKVTLRGETTFPNDFTQNTVALQFADGVLTSANEDETTPVLNSKKTDGSGLALYNINITNTYAQTSNTAALAADFYGTAMAAYGCAFVGFQDTLLVNQGVQVFSNSYVEGSVDYIWGYSKAYFHQCYIASNTGGGSAITAQNRPSTTWAGGFVFDTCRVTYTASYKTSQLGTTYLGRPWSEYAIAVYMNSYLDAHISTAGWEQWSTSSPNTDGVLFGEFNNSGPGSWTASTARAAFATNLTASEAAAYSLDTFLGDTSSWLDATAYAYVPSYALGASTTNTTSTSTASATAVWAHPTSGTTPPAGAVLVSPDGAVEGSYSNLTAALASLPDDTSTQIIFMYPGYYVEQVAAIDRDGPTMIQGYTTASPGQTYAGNEVTVAFARGLSVSPTPAGHSDAETAVLTTDSAPIALYNVDVVNSDNLDGATANYVTLAVSIASTHTGFYGCAFIGWQDTLLTASKTGYQYYESCYIEGAIDFIWGYSAAYFKGCTIGAKHASSCVTAQSRASAAAVGGYVFDQCLFTAAANATVDLTQAVYLGRPYSEYARVVVKNSYLDDVIAPAGWKVWSASSPNTDYITFAEFNNSGPGDWQNNVAAREAFQNATLLTSDTYPLASVMDSTTWIDMTYWDAIVTPGPATTTTTTTNSSWVYNGTVAPAGAYIVAQTAVDGVETTYSTIQAALDAMPATSSKTSVATVFIYPGTYTEQLVVNRTGTTIFLGYSADPADWAANSVTITYSYGVDTGADESNSDSATVYATGTYFQAVNINFANTFGTTKNYASLGFAVKSSKYAGLYGCQVAGNQDALLINGYFFAYNTRVIGNVDMIWGSGAGYLLSSTIAPNEDGINLTADKRADNTTAAGLVFDQCTVAPVDADGNAVATYTDISLGRPWNSYARVAYVQCDLPSCIEAAGWNEWSSSTPNTDGVLFGEYENTGAGAATAGRAAFATQLTADEAAQFQLADFFAVTTWINMSLVAATPFAVNASSVVPVSSSASVSVESTTTSFFTVTDIVAKTTTDKETLTLTLPASTTTKTVDVVSTTNGATTITPSTAATKTTTAKTTTTSTITVVAPDPTTKQTTTVVVNGATTVTPATTLVTKTSTSKATASVTTTTTTTLKVTTVSTTTTVDVDITSTKWTTTTDTLGSTTTSVATKTPGSVKVTTTTTVVVGTGGTTTTTSTAEATTVTVMATTVKTSTAKATTTVCLVDKRRRSGSGPVVARGIVRRAEDELDSLDELDVDELERRAQLDLTATDTSTAFSTLTTTVTTKTTTQKASTVTTSVVDSTKTTGKTTTLKPTTVTTTVVSATTKATTLTLPASDTDTLWTTRTTTSGKPTTLSPSTTTSVLTVTTSTKTTTTTATDTPATPTVTATKTTTSSVKTTTTAVTTKTTSKNTTVKTTTTVATPTVTSTKTTTSTDKPSVTVTVVEQSTKTTTKTTTSTTTTTKWTTKTAC
ncbi:hypothetical protein SCUCBS95973_004120 [Sporothrix curviconia]|uniref:pectinesterase n=1 Tax=Sporothrix curviconia TaxID=1260050 RepID=A0ABP0BL35_9PEZI